MRLRTLLVACFVLPTSVGHLYECADAETSAAIADLTSKLGRVSSYYLELTRNVWTDTDLKANPQLRDLNANPQLRDLNANPQAIKARPFGVETLKIWYERPLLYRIESNRTSGRPGKDTIMLRKNGVSDGLMERSTEVSVRRRQKAKETRSAKTACCNLGRIKAAGIDLEVFTRFGLAASVGLDPLHPFNEPDSRTRYRWRLDSKPTISGLPCFRFKCEIAAYNAKGEFWGRFQDYLAFRESDAMLVHQASLCEPLNQRTDTIVSKAMVNCGFAPGTFVFNPRALGGPYPEDDSTDRSIKAFRDMGPSGLGQVPRR